MKKIILLLLLIPLCGFRDIGCTKIDIVVLVDMSGSVGGHEEFIHDALYSFANSLDIEENSIRMSIIRFNSMTDVIHTLDGDKEGIIKDINTYIKPGMADGSTFMYGAFTMCMSQLVKYSRPDAHQVVVVISDGAPSYPEEVKAQVNDMKSVYPVTIFGILVTSQEENSKFMEEISSPNCYFETNYEYLKNTINQMDLCM